MKFVILFAGAIGSGKSPIANYLSHTLNLPILNNDVIQTEVREDLLSFDKEVFADRVESRLKSIISKGYSFIYDASIDRRYNEKEEMIMRKAGYKAFIISLNLSYELLEKTWKAKDYQAWDALKRTIEDHETFLKQHSDKVNLVIDDKNFIDRLEISKNHVEKWIEENK